MENMVSIQDLSWIKRKYWGTFLVGRNKGWVVFELSRKQGAFVINWKYQRWKTGVPRFFLLLEMGILVFNYILSVMLQQGRMWTNEHVSMLTSNLQYVRTNWSFVKSSAYSLWWHGDSQLNSIEWPAYGTGQQLDPRSRWLGTIHPQPIAAKRKPFMEHTQQVVCTATE